MTKPWTEFSGSHANGSDRRPPVQLVDHLFDFQSISIGWRAVVVVKFMFEKR